MNDITENKLQEVYAMYTVAIQVMWEGLPFTHKLYLAA